MGPFTNQITPYLFFGGQCREAMEFYKKILGGDLNMMTYGDAPNCPKGAKDKVIHAALIGPEVTLLASDEPNGEPVVGSNIMLSLNCKSDAQVDSYFKALSEGGEGFLAPHDAFWGARFAMLSDRFGFKWMLNHEHKK